MFQKWEDTIHQQPCAFCDNNAVAMSINEKLVCSDCLVKENTWDGDDEDDDEWCPDACEDEWEDEWLEDQLFGSHGTDEFRALDDDWFDDDDEEDWFYNDLLDDEPSL